MAYRVFLSAAAQRDIRKLPKAVQEKVMPRIRALQDEPRPHGIKKLAGNEELYRIRVGDFRILFQIDDSASAVTIARAIDRKDAY